MSILHWRPMDTAPRDGSFFVVREHGSAENIWLVRWSEYADSEGGWQLKEGGVIKYEACAVCFPIPQS